MQYVFVSNCKMFWSQTTKQTCFSGFFSVQFFLKLFHSLCANSSAIWTGICGTSPVIELSQTAQELSKCALDHKMTGKITKIQIFFHKCLSRWATWRHWKPANVLPKASELVRLASPGEEKFYLTQKIFHNITQQPTQFIDKT